MTFIVLTFYFLPTSKYCLTIATICERSDLLHLTFFLYIFFSRFTLYITTRCVIRVRRYDDGKHTSAVNYIYTCAIVANILHWCNKIIWPKGNQYIDQNVSAARRGACSSTRTYPLQHIFFQFPMVDFCTTADHGYIYTSQRDIRRFFFSLLSTAYRGACEMICDVVWQRSYANRFLQTHATFVRVCILCLYAHAQTSCGCFMCACLLLSCSANYLTVFAQSTQKH